MGRLTRQAGRCSATAREGSVARRAELLSAVLQQAAAAGEQLGRHQLLEQGRSEVEAQPGAEERVHAVLRDPQPADAQATPVRLAQAADTDRSRGVRRERRRHLLPVEGQGDHRLVDHRGRTGAGERGGHTFPLGVAHQGAGRVVEVRDQVGHPGGHLAQGRQQALHVGSGDGGVWWHVHPDEPGTGVGQGRDRVGVGGALHDGPISGREQGTRRDRDTGQRPRDDHDLVGRGGQPAGGVRRGDRLPEHRQPRGVVAGAGEVGRELGGRLLVGGEHAGSRHRRRAGQVDLVEREVPGREQVVAAVAPGGRQARHAAGSLAGDEEAVVAQLGVRPGHGRAAHRQRLGQLTLARQAGSDRDPAVGDQHAQALRQPLVRRRAVELTEQGGYARRGEDAGHAGQ